MRSGSQQEAIDNQFLQAVTDGNRDHAESLLECDVSRYLPSITAINQAVVSSVRAHQVEMTKWLLKKGADADQLAKPEMKVSLLQYAAYYENAEMVATLLPFVKRIDHVSLEGQTALHYAIAKRNIQISGLLMQNNASLNHRSVDRKGRTPRSQIGMILKKGCIEIARELFIHRPTALAEFQKVYPNIISYICKDPDADIETCSAMVEYLVTEVPAVFLLNNQSLDEKIVQEIGEDLQALYYSPDIITLCKSRIDLNAFFLKMQNSAGKMTSKQIEEALSYIVAPNPALLASDLFMILADNHPIISKDRLRQIFLEHLAIFISPAKSSVSMRLGVMLKNACECLLKSDMRDSSATQVICKLTLLTLMQTVAHGKEDAYGYIVELMKAMIPSTSGFLARQRGEPLLAQYIQNHHEDVAQFMVELKAFYCSHLRILLSPDQVNPCTKIEMMIHKNMIQRVQAKAETADQLVEKHRQTILFLETQLAKAREENNDMLALIASVDAIQCDLKKSNLTLRADIEEKDQRISSLATECSALRFMLAKAVHNQNDSPLKAKGKSAVKKAGKKQERAEQDEEPAMPLIKRAFFERDLPAAAPAPATTTRITTRASARAPAARNEKRSSTTKKRGK